MPPDTYSHGHHESVLRSHRWRTAENSAAYLLPHLAPGQSLLDVGCGPGNITLDLAARVAPGPVLGIDAAEDAVAAANEINTAPDHVTFAVGDVYALDAPDATYDVVHAHQVLQHLSHPVDALREMRRVTRPGGVVAVRDGIYASFAWAPDNPLLVRWNAAVPPDHGAQPRRGRRRPVPPRLGAAGGVHGRHVVELHLDLRRPRVARVVGWALGGPGGGVVVRRAGRRVRLRRSRRARDDLGGVAHLGRAARRLVRRAPRRDPRPRLNSPARGQGAVTGKRMYSSMSARPRCSSRATSTPRRDDRSARSVSRMSSSVRSSACDRQASRAASPAKQ